MEQGLESTFCTYCRRAVRRYIGRCVKDSTVEALLTGLTENQLNRICDDEAAVSDDSDSGSTVRFTIFSSIILLSLSIITTF